MAVEESKLSIFVPEVVVSYSLTPYPVAGTAGTRGVTSDGGGLLPCLPLAIVAMRFVVPFSDNWF